MRRLATDIKQYVPLPAFETVTSALNFSTPELHISGGCDLYTTKAAGSDIKLYKNIETSLENSYSSLLRISASLSPPQAEIIAPQLDLSRSSPFGPLSQISSRRTFAYLIATLNASHPDYDFSHILRPSDFRREKSLRTVMNTIDSTLYNLRPESRVSSVTAGIGTPGGGRSTPLTPGGSVVWGPRMWRLIDKEMALRECNIYVYQPDEDPFDGEEGAIWSHHYFFFNKTRKRVCYVYLRARSVILHSPVPTMTARSGRSAERADEEMGANKRAKYWLGDRAKGMEFEDEDDEEYETAVDVDVISDNSFDDEYEETLKGERGKRGAGSERGVCRRYGNRTLSSQVRTGRSGWIPHLN